MFLVLLIFAKVEFVINLFDKKKQPQLIQFRSWPIKFDLNEDREKSWTFIVVISNF